MSQRPSTVLTCTAVVLGILAVVSTTLFGVERFRALDRELDAAAATPSPSRTPTATPSSSPSSPGATSTPATPSPSPDVSSTRVDELLGLLTVLPTRPQIDGYDRECGPGDGCVFGTDWTDDTDAPDGHNGCDTRNDVLREQLLDVEFKAGSHNCDVVDGHFVDPYTGTPMDYATEGSQIHIDHLFPLAAAWDLGAATWSLERRTRFANDTSVELLAVNGRANESKGDSTPASWLPPVKPYRCEYVVRFLTVAAAYGLAITQADVRVIASVQRESCPA